MRHGTNGFSIQQLKQLLKSRQSQVQKLERRRAKLARKLNAVDERIRALGGTGGQAGPGSRPRNEVSLIEAIESVLKGGKSLKVGDIAEAVQASGYRSNSANFRGIVNQTLIKDKRFTSTSRGVYGLKK